MSYQDEHGQPASISNDIAIEYASDIVSAYVSNNPVQTAVDVQTNAKPAISIKKSITDEFLICLEDGKKFKSLKRHLRSKYGISPEEYREKWGLPYDYPMVAPSYARKRSALAKQMGLGKVEK